MRTTYGWPSALFSNLVEGSGGSQLRTKARVIRIRRDSPSLLLKVAHG